MKCFRCIIHSGFISPVSLVFSFANKRLVLFRVLVFAGLLLYVSSTVNPILYNLMSKRYRQAFRETLCCCIGQKNPRRFSFGNSHTEQTVNNSVRTVRFLSTDKAKPVYGSKRLEVPGNSDCCLQERLLSGGSKASSLDEQNGCVVGCKKKSDSNGRLLGRNELPININGHSPGEVCLSPITSDNSRQQLLAEECQHDNTPLWYASVSANWSAGSLL